MSNPAGILESLEQAVADRISTGAYFADKAVLVDPQKNILNEIQTKIQKLTLLIAPLVCRADDTDPNLLLPYFSNIPISVSVFHNPLLGVGTAHPREVCEQIHLRLKGWVPDNFTSSVQAAVPGIEMIDDSKLNIYNCNFTTRGGCIGVMTKLAAVTWVSAGGQTTLAGATAGAAIFYTIDGTTPMPLTANGPGALYTAPVAFASGTVVKARAFLAGYLYSDILTFTAP